MALEKIADMKTGLRAQDIQTSIQDLDLGPITAEIENVRLVGMAERLAIHIRGADVVDDFRRLKYVASQFGIDSLVLPSVLNVLQDLGWVRVIGSGDSTRVEETVPYFSDIYSKAGDYLDSSKPTEIESATLLITDSLAVSPIPSDSLRQNLGLDADAYSIVLDIGRAGGLIGEYESKKTKETILYSPMYWLENPSKVEGLYDLLRSYGADKVYQTMKKVREYQGF